MNHEGNRSSHNRFLFIGGGLVLALIFLSGLILSWLLWGNRPRPIKPIRTPAATVAVDGQPLNVTFPQLSQNLVGFRDQRIRVTGNYRSLPAPTCNPFAGPIIRWALVSEGLQLNAIGFEPLLRLVPTNALMTIEGIWREYRGPSGCFGASHNGRLWYLEVERILQPNPLPGRGNLFVDNSGPGGTEGTGGGESISPPGTTAIPGTPLSPTGQPLETPDTGIPTTATATSLFTTPGITTTPTAVGGNTTPTLTPTATPPVIPTIGASTTPTLTPTFSPGGTPTPTPTAASTPVPGPTLPGLPTSTPGGGYPPPEPTPTTDPYT